MCVFYVQMLNEFCSLTGAEECKFKENWGKYEKLVFKYAPLEQKKSLKNLLHQYHAEECDNAGRCIYKFCALDQLHIFCAFCTMQIELQLTLWTCSGLYCVLTGRVDSRLFLSLRFV